MARRIVIKPFAVAHVAAYWQWKASQARNAADLHFWSDAARRYEGVSK